MVHVDFDFKKRKEQIALLRVLVKYSNHWRRLFKQRKQNHDYNLKQMILFFVSFIGSKSQICLKIRSYMHKNFNLFVH